MTFDELLAARVELIIASNAHWDTHTRVRATVDEAFTLAAKRKGAKNVTSATATKHLTDDELEKIRAPFQARWDAARKAHQDAADENDKQLYAAARDATFSSPDERTEWLLYKSCDTHRYSTQTGAVAYARSDAEELCDHAREYDIESEQRTMMFEGKTYDVRAIDVYVKVASIRDVELLKHKPSVPIWEWVRKCWTRGANPRVKLPFLLHGFEEMHGFNWQGQFKFGNVGALALSVRDSYENGDELLSIAQVHGISTTVANDIVRRQVYRHVV